MARGAPNIDHPLGNQTMFDLNKQIEAWRAALSQAESMRGQDVDELEAHLRDAVEKLRTAGLSDEEAFLIAARRLGTHDGLATEFGKINGQLVGWRRLWWMLLGFLVFSVLLSWVTAVSGALTPSKTHNNYFLYILTLVQIGTLAGIAWLIVRRKIRSVVAIALVVAAVTTMGLSIRSHWRSEAVFYWGPSGHRAVQLADGLIVFGVDNVGSDQAKFGVDTWPMKGVNANIGSGLWSRLGFGEDTNVTQVSTLPPALKSSIKGALPATIISQRFSMPLWCIAALLLIFPLGICVLSLRKSHGRVIA